MATTSAVGGSPRPPWPGCRCTCGSCSSRPRRGTVNVSSEELADLAGVNAAKVRKDLSYLGTYGTRGVGYEVEYLIYQVRRELGLTHDWPVVIVGAGNLGQALAGYGGFGERGFPVAGIVDIDAAKVGTVIGGVRVRAHRRPRRDRAHRAGVDRRRRHPRRGRPGRGRPAGQGRRHEHPQLRAGACWRCPPGVKVRKVDLAVELQILSYYEQRRVAAAGRQRRCSRTGRSRRGASA